MYEKHYKSSKSITDVVHKTDMNVPNSVKRSSLYLDWIETKSKYFNLEEQLLVIPDTIFPRKITSFAYSKNKPGVQALINLIKEQGADVLNVKIPREVFDKILDDIGTVINEQAVTIEVEELWNKDIIRDDIVLTNFMHGKYYPNDKCFKHLDFSVNQYAASVYGLKFSDIRNETGVPIDKYCTTHYKVWYIEAETININTWSTLVAMTLDEPFRELFFEMFYEKDKDITNKEEIKHKKVIG